MCSLSGQAVYPDYSVTLVSLDGIDYLHSDL